MNQIDVGVPFAATDYYSPRLHMMLGPHALPPLRMPCTTASNTTSEPDVGRPHLQCPRFLLLVLLYLVRVSCAVKKKWVCY